MSELIIHNGIICECCKLKFDAWGQDTCCEKCKAKLGDTEEERAFRIWKWYKARYDLETIAFHWGISAEYCRRILLAHYPFLRGEL